MAWITWKTGKDGVRRAHVQWRVPTRGLPRSKWPRESDSLGAISDEAAEIERLDYEERFERRAPKPMHTSALDAIGRFKRWLEARGRTPETVSYYEDKVGGFLAWIGKRRLDEITAADLDEYIVDRRERASWGESQVGKAVVAMRKFVRWAHAQKPPIAVGDFTDWFEIPAADRYEAIAWAPEEVAAIIKESRVSAQRGWAPLEVPIALAFYAAMPLRDFRELDWKEIDRSAGKGRPWVIRGERHKTHVVRAIPVCDELQEVLARYRSTHGPVCRGLPKDDGTLSQAFRRLQRRAKIRSERIGGWHRLRHSALSILGARKEDLATIGAIACHAPGSKETLKYLHTDDERKIAAVKGLGEAIG